jgi:hypothetical protein
MRNALSILCLALAFCVAAPSADAGCKPFAKWKEKRAAKACANVVVQSPLTAPVAASVVVAPAAPAAAVTGVLTWGAPFCAGGKCSVKVRVR